MRRMLRRILAPMGYEVHWDVERHALDVLDMAVRSYLAHRDVWFVQAGANDGVMRDPMRRFVDRYGWRGILIEPVPWLFERLKQNYPGREGLIFENVAIGNGGDLTLFTLEDAPDLPDWARGLTSFDRKVLLRAHRAHPRFESLIREIKVPCFTLDALLQKHGLPRVDLLQVDTEGYDFEVMKTLDFARWRPKVVHFEHVHLRHVGGVKKWRECYRWLEERGYALQTTGDDTVGVLNEKQ